MSKPAETKPPETARCSKRVYRDSFAGHACMLKPKVKRDGHWYCAIHDPVEVKRRRDANDLKRSEAREARYELYQRMGAIEAAKDAVVQAARLWAKPSSGPALKPTDTLLDAVAKLEALDFATKEPK